MSIRSTKLTAAFMACLMTTALATTLLAHPGHGPRTPPDIPSPDGCDGCETTASLGAEAPDGNSGNGFQTESQRLVVGTRSLLKRSKTMKAKLVTMDERVLVAHDRIEQTGQLSASYRRQVLRSLRSAGRTNQQLVRDLTALLDSDSDQITPDIRAALEADLAVLNANAAYLSAQQARLSNVSACEAAQCAEVVDELYTQTDKSGEGLPIDGLSQTLNALYSSLKSK